MPLILVRHGNTFEPGAPVVWVGARSDVPLAAKGLAQARAVGELLLRRGGEVADIYCGPLRRTADTARIIAQTLGTGRSPSVHVDERLRELDYGSWEGLSTEDIVARFGRAEFEAWEQGSVWPVTAGWKPPKADVLTNVRALLHEWKQKIEPGNQAVVVVSSNGFFRLLAEVIGVAGKDRKMATGHVSLLILSQSGEWQVEAWNATPAAL
jgi:broad specificity phosphatase PhoE